MSKTRSPRSADHPHVAAGNKYAKDVVSGKILACKWVVLACKRHLDDLEASKGHNFPYRFDSKAAEKWCRFLELLPHTKGEWARKGLKLKLEPWQCFKTVCLFGWLRKQDGLRRFRKALILEPRKNAKSTWAAGVGLGMMSIDGDHGAEVYSGATTEKQAWEVFKPARLMAMKTPAFVQHYGVTVGAKNIHRLGDGSKFEPLIGDPGDEANTLLIQGVAAQIDDPSTGLDALAQVQSTMQGQISSLDGVVMVMGQSIDDLLLSVDDLETGKADIGITDGLQAQINQMGGGEGLSLIAEAIRSMHLTVEKLALGQAGVWLAGQNDRRELGNIVADVHQEATSRIDVTDDQVALHGRILDQINLDLGGKAGLDIVSALDGRVTATEGEIETIGTSLVSINASIGDLETGKADASAVNGLTTRVTSTEAGLQSLSEALIDVDATVGNMSADGRLRVQATATETGALATAAFGLAATSGGEVSRSAMLMSALAGGDSVIGFLADLIYFRDPNGDFDLFAIEDGTAYINRARIRDLDAVNFTADKIDAKLILQNGSVIEDLIDVDTFSRSDTGSRTRHDVLP